MLVGLCGEVEQQSLKDDVLLESWVQFAAKSQRVTRVLGFICSSLLKMTYNYWASFAGQISLKKCEKHWSSQTNNVRDSACLLSQMCSTEGWTFSISTS